MKIINNEGPSTLHFGTPVLTGSALDMEHLNYTFCVLSVKQKRGHLTAHNWQKRPWFPKSTKKYTVLLRTFIVLFKHCTFLEREVHFKKKYKKQIYKYKKSITRKKYNKSTKKY